MSTTDEAHEIGQRFCSSDASDPAPPDSGTQDTPFIPIDDGYDSDNQSVPNNQLPIPDATDPELVPASLTLGASVDLWETWSLSFPSTVRIFQVQGDGTLTAVTAGQQSAPLEVGGSPILSFLVQGVGPIQYAGPATISATLTPTTDPNTSAPPPITQPTTHSVTANVGPSPLQALSVKDNAAGPALTSAQQTKSGTIFLPITDAADSLVYRLPIDVNGFAGTDGQDTAQFKVPSTWQVYNTVGSTLKPMSNAAGLVTLQPNLDYQLYLVAYDNGGSNLVNGAVKITLTGVDAKTGRAATGNLGTASISPIILSHTQTKTTNGVGPTDVPESGKYDYNIAKVALDSILPATGQWLDPRGAASQVSIHPNDMSITWNTGPDVGYAVYQADPQFVWDMPVNIYQISVDPAVNANNAGLAPAKPLIATDVKVQSSATSYMSATVTVTGPVGATGMNDITAGFVQNLKVATSIINYGLAGNATFVQASTGTPEVGTTYWDTQDHKTVNNKLYPQDAGMKINGKPVPTQFTPVNMPVSGSQSKTISTSDQPGIELPEKWKNPGKQEGSILSLSLEYDLMMYVVGTTDESPDVYTAEASTAWIFDAGGNFDNKFAFTATGAGATFQNNQWLAAQAQPVVAPPRFNDVGEKDNNLVPAPVT